MDFRLDSWRADYAFPYDRTPEEAAEAPEDPGAVDVAVEAPAHEWAPIRPHPATPPFEVVRFIDGVQASDAVIWITDPGREEPFPGLVASWAAGVITSRPTGPEPHRVVIEQLVVERGVFSDARSVGPIIAGNLTWRPRTPDGAAVVGGSVDVEADYQALRQRLAAARRRLEDAVGLLSAPGAGSAAGAAGAADPRLPGLGDGDGDALVVYDGLLHARAQPLAAVGLAKRAHRTYLPDALRPVQRRLRRGERTPLFATDPQRRKLSFYLALSDPLPPAVADPGSCVARLELVVGPHTTAGQAAAFADRVARTLPDYASEPHIDPRAPQNLMPIRSLEAELRRHLGRPATIRPLLAAEAAGSRGDGGRLPGLLEGSGTTSA